MKRDWKDRSNKDRIAGFILSCLSWGNKNLNISQEKALTIRSSIDLLEDTEEAILYFSKYGLEKYSTKFQDQGEKYLKLYGVLNAVYLQYYAISEIETQLINKHTLLQDFQKLQINKLRRIAGAHTVNVGNKHSYRVSQSSITAKSEELYCINQKDDSIQFNLYECIMEYNQIAEKGLYEIISTYSEQLKLPKKEILDLKEHYYLSSFSEFDYRRLYQNDKLQRRYFSRIQRELEKGFKKLKE